MDFSQRISTIESKVNNEINSFLILPPVFKITVLRKKLEQYKQRREYLIEAKDKRNDFAIQQYAIQIQQLKLWIITEQEKIENEKI